MKNIENRYLIYLTFSLIILANYSCNLFKSERKTYFNGKIIKKTSNKITLLKDEYKLKESDILNDGTFSMIIDSLKNGLYNFQLQPEFQYILLNNGDSLSLRLNSLDFDESLVFIGKGAPKNNFLIDVFLNHEQEEEFINSNLKKKPILFKKLVDSLLLKKNNNYKTFKKQIKLTITEKLIIANAIKLPLYTKMETYASINRNNNFFKTKNSFFDFRKDINFDLKELVHFKPYLDYLIVRFSNDARTILNSKIKNDLEFNLERIKLIDRNIINTEIKSKLLRHIAYEYLLKERKLIDIDTFLNIFNKISVNKEINAEIEELYNNIAALQIGKKLPKLNLIDIKNRLNYLKSNNQNPIVHFFWSYEQTSHQNAIFDRINKILMKGKKFNFYSININDDNTQWIQYLENINKNKNITHFRSTDFKKMSKKMVLNNLNKIIITDHQFKIIEISDIIYLEDYIKTY